MCVVLQLAIVADSPHTAKAGITHTLYDKRRLEGGDMPESSVCLRMLSSKHGVLISWLVGVLATSGIKVS